MKRAITHLSTADRKLGAHIQLIGRCRLRPERQGSPLLALAQSIAYQQLTGRAAKTIWERVLAVYGGQRGFTAKAILRTPDLVLRSAGLSTAKVASLKSLAEHADRRIVPSWAALERLDDEEIIERLIQVRGIGPWTVQMLLIFSLGRPDVLPVTDYGVQKGYSLVYRKRTLPSPKELQLYGERWRPFRTYAAWYLWRATDSAAGRA